MERFLNADQVLSKSLNRETDSLKVEVTSGQVSGGGGGRDQYPRAVARLSDGTLKYYAIKYGGKIAPQGFKDVRA